MTSVALRIIKLLTLSVAFVLVGTAGAHALSSKATVLIYHKFNEPDSPSTSISTEVFEKQIKFLLDSGYKIVPLHTLVNAIKHGRAFPEKSVVITIDDGYRSTYTEALPILKKYSLPFTLFLYMEGVGRFPAYMTREQLKDMARYPKVTFGLHSYYHKPLGSITDRKYLEQDTMKAIKRFKKLLGRAPKYYAYPYGEYNHIVIDVIKKHSLEAGLTQDPFNCTPDTDPYLIPRVPMVGSWATLKSLKRFLETETIQVKDFSPSFGILSRNPPGTFTFRVVSLKSYKNIRFYISELGWLKPKIDLHKGVVTIDIRTVLHRRVNRVALEAVDSRTGHRARFFYLIVKPSP